MTYKPYNCKKDINIIIVMIIMITIIYYLILKFTLHNNSNVKNVQDVQVLNKGTELAQYATHHHHRNMLSSFFPLPISFRDLKVK